MAVEWSLGQAPRGGMLDALKAYQLGGAMRQQQVQQGRDEDTYMRGERQRQALGAAIDPMTGRVDEQAASSAYAEGGDLEGLLAYRKTLQGEQVEQAKLIGQLAKGARDQAGWTVGLEHAVRAGAITQEEAQEYGEFSPQSRTMAMALGGVEDDAFNMSPGEVRMRGDEVVARSPYKPEIITGADGSKFVYDPNDGDEPVRVQSPEEAMQLPPGTRFITPDGEERVMGGGAGNGTGGFPG